MRKRGLSQVVAIAIFIVIGLLAVTALWMFTRSMIDKHDIDKSQEFLNCVQEVHLQILDACYDDNLLKITVKNKRELILGDFFLVDMLFLNGTTQRIPTPYHTYVGPYKTETIIVPNKPDIDEITVIPKIEEQTYLCPDSAPTYTAIKPC